MKTFRADLHIHTALSPCGDAAMTPPAIVRTARAGGLDLIAICDHNAAGNVAATMTAAAALEAASPAAGELAVLAGIEITTAEEVHVVGLLPDVAAAEAVAAAVQATLPTADAAYYARFGEQTLMTSDGAACGTEPRMLAAGTTLELAEVVGLIRRHGGVALAAHVNRPSFSVLSQLGLFPEDVGFDAIEVFTPCTPGAPAPRPHPTVAALAAHGLPVLASSDAHYLGDIGRACSIFEMQAPTFDELARTLHGAGGRRVAVA
jgi:3',5'-nucleoside bisphosphate phosphatase